MHEGARIDENHKLSLCTQESWNLSRTTFPAPVQDNVAVVWVSMALGVMVTGVTT